MSSQSDTARDSETEWFDESRWPGPAALELEPPGEWLYPPGKPSTYAEFTVDPKDGVPMPGSIFFKDGLPIGFVQQVDYKAPKGSPVEYTVTVITSGAVHG